MRLFFALEPARETALQIADWRDRQFPASAARPVPIANLHITLAFIGELPPPRLERLLQAVDDWRDRPRSASLHMDCTGYWQRPGIYWLGPREWPQQLEKLARRLGAISGQVGGRQEKRRFQPHVTLFRGCREAPPQPAQEPSFVFAYHHFTLFESRQGKRGVSYQPLADWALQ